MLLRQPAIPGLIAAAVTIAHVAAGVVPAQTAGGPLPAGAGQQPAVEQSSEGSGRVGPHAGSAYVPIDSWVYPALDRLSAFGLIQSQTAGLRPWTRAECRRQVEEAARTLSERPSDFGRVIAEPLIEALEREFSRDTGRGASLVLESVSIRNGVLAGPVLNDSFHFGQTVSNDFGRPFGRGWNSYAGITARAEWGRWFAFVRAEYQHAPGRGAYDLQTRELIAQLDGTPVQPAEEVSSTDRFRPVEAYAGVRLGNLEISAGKQSLWWGPTYDAPLSFSSNAEPTKNVRISTVYPLRMAGVLRYLGAVRGEFILGKLGGHAYTWRPWFNAQKLSFKLTENLEIGFTRWSIFWGVGHPMTLRSFVRNFTSTYSPLDGSGVGPADPGDRKGGFDFRYRVPGLRNWLTLYSDSYCDDDPSPLAAPRRAAISPGIYLSHVPGIPRLDFRMEAASTQPMGSDHGGSFIYINSQYLSGNTNYGTLLGNSVGRDGRAIQAWTTYSFAARKTVTASYRQLKGGGRFLPGGSTQTQASLQGAWELGRRVFAQATVQMERYYVPALGGPRRNAGVWIALRWEPEMNVLEELRTAKPRPRASEESR